MNSVLSILVFALYLFLINYFAQMLVFDYYKYIKKDKYLKNMKYKYSWKYEYYKRKAYDEVVENNKNSFTDDEVKKNA